MAYKFMQLYGNCTVVHCLGHGRLRGPTDNVVTKGVNFLKTILHSDYIKYLKTTAYATKPREPEFNGDSPIEYMFPIVNIVHNDITKDKTWAELKLRMTNFNAFKQKVLTDAQYYFVYSINDYDLDKRTHKINLDIFIENIKYLQQEGLLNKIVFVETKNSDKNAFWNFYAINIQDIIKKYNLIYIQINDITKGADDEKIIMPQFYKKASDAIQKKGTK